MLREFALEVAAGNLDERVDVHSNDEVGLLADTMNQMTCDLKRSREEIAIAAKQEAVLHDTLLKEIHHRVKNNMQILSSMMRMQRRITAATDVKNILLDGEARIRSMGLIHEKLYQSNSSQRWTLAHTLTVWSASCSRCSGATGYS
ncbi:MAG: histidine kinase dimerization/phosphoacceptor domain -containing protein [Verrucomicrobiales bacterium]